MTLIRRNPLQSAIGALLAVGLVVTAVMAGTGSLRKAAFTGCGYGYSYETGSNNQFGYGSACTPASNQFAQGRVFVVQPGQQLTLSGSTGVSNAAGQIVLDFGGTTGASATDANNTAASDNGSKPQHRILGNFTTDARGNFTVTVTIPSDVTFGRHAISAVLLNGAASASLRSSDVHAAALQEVVRAILIVVPDIAGNGYRLVAGDGGSFNFGNNLFHGSVPQQLNGKLPNKPVVGGDNTVSNQGYWMAASDGGMFSFGDAVFYGSLPGVLNGKLPNKPIVGMARTPTGNGYWLAASDGGVFAFGDAKFLGSVPGVLNGRLPNKPVVGIATTPSGNGYWLVSSDGGLFAFGDAPFFGSVPGQLNGRLPNQPVVAIAALTDGSGYWMASSDGGQFSFGSAQFFGSLPGQIGKLPNKPIVGMHAIPGGTGYRMAASDGGIFDFGSANFFGSVPGQIGKLPNLPIVAMSRL